jgi:hypothetical protein
MVSAVVTRSAVLHRKNLQAWKLPVQRLIESCQPASTAVRIAPPSHAISSTAHHRRGDQIDQESDLTRGLAAPCTTPNYWNRTNPLWQIRAAPPKTLSQSGLHLTRAARMAALAGNLGCLAGTLAIRAAVIASFSRLATAGRVSAFFILCHISSVCWTRSCTPIVTSFLFRAAIASGVAAVC